jgi:type III pantothenate kinase
MANLVIDIGNTRTKIAVFELDELLHTSQYQHIDSSIINGWLSDHTIGRAIISSVKKNNEDWQESLSATTPVCYFNASMTGNITNKYETPETLGLDRLAAAIGAYNSFPGIDNLIIDAGTCITYDFIDSTGNYFGGSISPGLNMRYKALNYYTAALPLIDADECFDDMYGKDTPASMRSGVQNGIKFELTGFIGSYKKAGSDMNVILTGGDSIFFDTLLKNSIFAPCVKIDPYLVLKGLNAVIQNNND